MSARERLCFIHVMHRLFLNNFLQCGFEIQSTDKRVMKEHDLCIKALKEMDIEKKWRKDD